MFTLVCGMQSEAKVFQGHPNLQVLYGTARNNLTALIPKGCKGLISAGTAGGLVAGLNRGDLSVGNSVVTSDGKVYPVDHNWLAAVIKKYHGAYHIDRIYSAVNEIMQTPDQRKVLAKKHNVAADDQESWAVAQTAKELKLPFIVIRAISDQSDQTLLPDDDKAVNPDGTINVIPLIPDFLAHPAEAMLEEQGLNQALASLKEIFNVLGPTFAYPGT